MPESFKAGCQRPKPKVLKETKEIEVEVKTEKEVKTMIQLGKKAPNFELAAYHKGEFKTFTLDEFLGKWVVLCFYPGDFTFV